jgi:hypothetical protein
LKPQQVLPQKNRDAIFSIGSFSNSSLEISDLFKPNRIRRSQYLNHISIYSYEKSIDGMVLIQFYQNESNKPEAQIGAIFVANISNHMCWSKFRLSEYRVKVPSEGLFYSLKWMNSGKSTYPLKLDSNGSPLHEIEVGVIESEKREEFQFTRKNDGEWEQVRDIRWRGLSLTQQKWSFMINVD